ncbi:MULTISPECIES: META domain-containing protein [Spirosoma]|uniref:META domain-containing protein n=1 Tax=Spirosoma liriopis TaxID=2937440 RepID=A0ABT0HII6_9BACT|nr:MULTISPECIES: META domain-containing protein [Spirosoma]MCK8491969.1 META domain-containing protein [Spirosoma liriopis]UHG91289.1 META domain-containing protein [Spirosoma oryzicola]
MKRRQLMAFVILLMLAGCGKREHVVPPSLAKLVGTWQLIEPDSSYAVTLTFTYDNNNPPIDITPFIINGQSSVNTYTARMFATVDGTMQINEVVRTEKAGSAAAMQFEESYLANLKTVVRFESPTENRIHLFHGGAKSGVLVYKKL